MNFEAGNDFRGAERGAEINIKPPKEERDDSKKEVAERAVHSEATVNKDWEDKNLPDQFKADAWQTEFLGKKKVGGVEFLQFKGINFGIPEHKMPPGGLHPGDKIEVVKLTHEGSSYQGDGIIRVTNLTTGQTIGFKNWQDEKEEELQRLRDAVKNAPDS